MINFPNIGLIKGKVITFLDQKNILLCRADGNYTTLHLLNGDKFISSKNLKEIESLFSAEVFFRVHNSYLINMTHIVSFTTEGDGSLMMQGQFNVPVSKGKKSEFLQKVFNI